MKNYRNIFESLAREKISNILGITNDNRIQNLAIIFNIDDRFWNDCPEHIISCPVEYLHFGGGKAEGSGSWRQKERKG